jgi:putative flavoprotein involved in K+ transport
LADAIDDSVFQIHGGHFKNEKQLPPGNTLVVGSAQTGVQIAEDLIDNGRKVFLSTSRVGRMPRRFRGRDIMYWILDAKMFDVTPDMITDPTIFENRTPQVSGTGRYGHTVSLQSLHRKGAIILGKLIAADHNALQFAQNAKEHILHGDMTSAQTKAALEHFVTSNNLIAPPPEIDPADEPDINYMAASDITTLDLRTENITSIIWCNGFTGDYRYLKLPVLNEKGMPLHRNGISPVPGLYFLGIYWLRSRKSGIIHGIAEDSEFIISQLRKNAGTSVGWK